MSGTTADIDGLGKQARKLLRNGKIAESITTFQQALELDEARSDLHEGIATAYFFGQDYPQAVEHFKRVSQLSPNEGKPLINLGAVYNRMGEYNEAVKILRRGIQKDKNHSEGFYNLGYAYRSLNQLSMAISAYREAARLSPESAEAATNLASVYSEMGNHQQSIIFYKKALEISPEFERAVRGLAQAEHSLADSKKAISPFGRLVDTQTAGAKGPSQLKRELTETERLSDRQTVYAISSEVKSHSRELLQLVRENLEPALLALDRAVSSGTEGTAVLPRVVGDYQAAVKSCAESRRRLKRKMLELRAHEELINAPKIAPKK